MECVAGAAGQGFWSRRLEEGGSTGDEDANDDLRALGQTLHPKGLHSGPGPGPGPPYSGSYRKFVNHLVRSNFSDSLDDDSSFVGVDADRVSVVTEEEEEVPPLPPPRPPRLGPRTLRRPASRGLRLRLGLGGLGGVDQPESPQAAEAEQSSPTTPTTTPPTPERPPRLAPRRPAAACPAPTPPQRPPRAPARHCPSESDPPGPPARGWLRSGPSGLLHSPQSAQLAQPAQPAQPAGPAAPTATPARPATPAAAQCGDDGDEAGSRRTSASSASSSGSERRRRVGVVAMLDEKVTTPPGPPGRLSPSGEDEDAWCWKAATADAAEARASLARARCCSSDSAIALPDEDEARLWPQDDADDDIPAGSDASCQAARHPDGKASAAATTSPPAATDDGVFEPCGPCNPCGPCGEDAWRSVCLAGLSLDDVRWSRFAEDDDALVADGCDERGRRVKVFSFDSYDSGVSIEGLRRASTQSDDAHPPYRYWRTPSVVVSDFSDDQSNNAVTLEEIELFRRQHASRSADGDLSSTDVSRASSCSNLQQLDADYALRCSGSRKSSYCSSCSTLSGDEDAGPCDGHLETVRPRTKPSGWRKIRSIVTWTPFVQNYKNQQYYWVQLAGHQGNFRAGPTPGTILKKVCTAEELAFKALMKDRLKPYVPDYKGQITSEEGDSYLHLQDLLSEFNKPCVMDCKMGVRTYLEDELNKARGNQKLRKDMYDKMIAVNPDEPTEDERRAGGVTKTRYMVFRETMSSTATLGFRIEGLKKSDGQSSKDFKTTKDRDQIAKAFRDFTRGFPHAVSRYIQRLRAIKATLEVSEFFATHEVIGSSLLFVHDADKANIWLIDFAKSRVLPPGVAPITHSRPWIEGNHEDGYLIGLGNLIDIFTELEQHPETPPTPPPESPSPLSSPESESPSASSPAPESSDTTPPTSPEDAATAEPGLVALSGRTLGTLSRKDTLVAEERPVQLELRPHRDAVDAVLAVAAEAGRPDAAGPPAISQPSQTQRLAPALPLPVHIKKTDTVLTLQTPAEAAALDRDRTELT